MHRKLAYVSTVFMVALVVFASGCSGKKKHGAMATDTDVLQPTESSTENQLGERFGDESQRITDVKFENVLFSYNQYEIQQSEAAKIQAVAQYMQQNANVRLITEGNCDERGSREYNVALGENRAQAVRAYLISLGIDGNRIQTKSYGEENPLDPGHSEAAWSVNRRVEFALYR